MKSLKEKLLNLFQPIDLTKGKPWKVILYFALPIFISYLFQQIYAMADSMIVGLNLPNQFAGVSDTSSLSFIILQFAFGATAGFSVLTSKMVGKRDINGIRKSFAISIWVSLIISIVLTVAAILATNFLLSLVQVTPENDMVTYQAAYVYITIIFGGLIGQVFYNLICSVLRAIGDSVIPLVFLIASSILNIVLDIIFVKFMPTEILGVAGAAIATIVAQAAAAIGCFIFTFIYYPQLRLSRKDFAIDWKFTYEHIKSGFPLGFQFSILAIGLITLQGAIVKFDLGTSLHAAQDGYGAASKFTQFLFSPLNAIGTAMISYVSQNLGNKQFERIKQGCIQAYILGLIATLLVQVLGFLLCINGAYLYLFIQGDAVSESTIFYGTYYMFCTLPFYYILSLLFICRNSIQGLEKSFYPFMAGVAELVARTVISIYIPQWVSPDNLVSSAAFIGVCFSDCLAWIAADICLFYPMIRYIHLGKMKNIKIETIEEQNSTPLDLKKKSE